MYVGLKPVLTKQDDAVKGVMEGRRYREKKKRASFICLKFFAGAMLQGYFFSPGTGKMVRAEGNI